MRGSASLPETERRGSWKGRIRSLPAPLMKAAFCSLFLLAVSTPAATDRGLALHLPLVSDLKDHSPAHHPIEVVGNVRIESEGAWFGGRMDWLEAPHIPLSEREFAVAVWIRETSRERHVGLVEQCDLASTGHHLHLMLRENRQPYFGFLDRDQISPVGVPREQVWMHLVYQYACGFQQIWINGHLVISRRAEPYQGTTGVTSIGKAPRWGNLPTRDFVGYMRDFRIYHRALEAGEIAALAVLREGSESKPDNAQTAGAAGGDRPDNALAASLAAILPEDKTQPFIEIDGSQVTVNGRPGQIYVLQRTSDFVTWTPLKWFTNDMGKVIYIESADAPRLRFYRVLVEGPAAATSDEP